MDPFPLGRFSVDRIGLGAIQLPGPGAFGPSRDRDAALAVLRRAVDLGVNHILLGPGAVAVRAGAVRAAVGRAGRGLLLGALVHRLGDLVERAVQRLGLGVDLGGVIAGQRLADRLDRLLDLLLRARVDRVAQVLELALGLVGGVFAVVPSLGELALPAVVLGV